MKITLNVPDELVTRLRDKELDLARVLELGLRELSASETAAFSGSGAVIETLATLPDPREVLALRPSEELEARIHELLEKNRTSGLSESEAQEWQRYEFVEHIVRLAKANALKKLNS